jgi:hypothetical protein
MNDADLRSRLSALRPPALSEPAVARARFRASLAHAAARATPPAPVAHRDAPRPHPSALFRQLVSALALPVLAALLLLPLFRHTSSPSPHPAATIASASRQLLAELEALFPGQLEAVVERNGAIQLELADAPTVPAPADQAVLVEFIRGAQRLRVLAYSGRLVRLRLDRDELQFSPLLTGTGQVLLAGDDFAWSSSTPASPEALAGWQITARPLAAVL